MTPAFMAAQAAGYLINLLVATIGIRQADKILDSMRKKMVADQRGPNPDEIAALMRTIDDRSSRIQNS